MSLSPNVPASHTCAAFASLKGTAFGSNDDVVQSERRKSIEEVSIAF
jgi:hypothetical protein